MKSLLFLTVSIMVLAACSDERGFRAKAFPPTAEQALRDQRACHCNGNGNNQPGDSQKNQNSPNQPGASAAPNGAGQAPDADANKKAEEAQPNAAAAEMIDERIDVSAKTLSVSEDPNAKVSDETIAKFKDNFSPEKSAQAAAIFKGISISTGEAAGQDIPVSMKVAIATNDGYDKALIVDDVVTYGQKTWKELKNKTYLNPIDNSSVSATDVSVQAIFCPLKQCDGKRLLWVLLTATGKDNQPVYAEFFQDLSDDGKNTVIHSTLSKDAMASFESAYVPPKMQQVEKSSNKEDGSKGSADAGRKDAVVITGDENAPKSQDRVQPDASKAQGEQVKADSSEQKPTLMQRFVNLLRQHKAKSGSDSSNGAVQIDQSKAKSRSPILNQQVDAQKLWDQDLKAKAAVQNAAPSLSTIGQDTVNSAQANVKSISKDDAQKAWDQALPQQTAADAAGKSQDGDQKAQPSAAEQKAPVQYYEPTDL
jgi:hypothetical protein